MKHGVVVCMAFCVFGCYPITSTVRIRNETPSRFNRPLDDTYRLKVSYDSAGLLKGQAEAYVIINGKEYQMQQSGKERFAYDHQVSCIEHFTIRFKILYYPFPLGNQPGCDIYFEPEDGDYRVTIDPVLDLMPNIKAIAFACTNRESCISHAFYIRNNCLTPYSLTGFLIAARSPDPSEVPRHLPAHLINTSGKDYTLHTNGFRAPYALKCGEAASFAIQHNHLYAASSGELVVTTDNPHQPEIRIPIISGCGPKPPDRHIVGFDPWK